MTFMCKILLHDMWIVCDVCNVLFNMRQGLLIMQLAFCPWKRICSMWSPNNKHVTFIFPAFKDIYQQTVHQYKNILAIQEDLNVSGFLWCGACTCTTFIFSAFGQLLMHEHSHTRSSVSAAEN